MKPNTTHQSLFTLTTLTFIFGCGVFLQCAAAADAGAFDEGRLAKVAASLREEPAGFGLPIGDRSLWKELSGNGSFAKTISEAEKLLQEPIPEQPDDLYLDFSRTGNRTRWQRVSGQRRGRIPTLVLAECLENKGRFVPAFEEVEDRETTALALTAAETGHLVFATMHTMSAPKTIDRIVDIFPAEQQGQIQSMLSESLLGIVTQTLLKNKTGSRAAALEILVATPAVRNIIREHKTHLLLSAMQTGQKLGMQTMEAALAQLVTQGVVSIQAAREVLPDSTVLDMLSRTEVQPCKSNKSQSLRPTPANSVDYCSGP